MSDIKLFRLTAGRATELQGNLLRAQALQQATLAKAFI